jgi:hypothetical protein
MVRISNAIRYLAAVQVFFAASAVLALFEITFPAVVLTTIGLILLIICFYLLVLGQWLVRESKHKPSAKTYL